jgi:hypothetical protein
MYSAYIVAVRDALVKMLDEALAKARPKRELKGPAGS